MKSVHIDASRSYDIFIGEGLLFEPELLSGVMDRVSKVLIVSDDNVFPLYGEALKNLLAGTGVSVESFIFEHGEESKNIATYASLLEYMCHVQMTRSDMIAALGGGVVGDLAGFAAATYQRGIRFIQIPTTLLSAVDASVGGKTAIDLKGGKNQCGCFYQPSLVLCDTGTFQTLPEREYRGGCAEIIKYAMLESEEFLNDLTENPVSENFEDVVARCVSIKKKYVMEDEFDTGMRMLLNFGHTFGHAIEAASGFSMNHGEAVALGMKVMTKACVKRGICGADVFSKLTDALGRYGLDSDVPYSAAELERSALLDKKSAGSSIRLVVTEGPGKCRTETVKKEELVSWMHDGGIA